MPEVLIDTATVVAFLDDGRSDSVLFRFLRAYDVLGYESDALLRKYLPHIEKVTHRFASLNRAFKVCEAVALTAKDGDLLERYFAVAIRVAVCPQIWADDFAAERLKRAVTIEEATAILARMIRDCREGTETHNGQIVNSEPLAIERVVKYANDHRLDPVDAKDRIVARYLYLASDCY